MSFPLFDITSSTKQAFFKISLTTSHTLVDLYGIPKGRPKQVVGDFPP